MRGRHHQPIPVGTEFDRLTVEAFVGINAQGKAAYRCRCACGQKATALASYLRSGRCRSCGCLAKEMAAQQCRDRLTTHGASGHPLFDTWANIMDRCLNPNCSAYPRYGGRGVKVCRRWQDPRKFFEDMGPKPGAEYSVERINNEGDYKPSNCRWATRKEQARNTPRNVYLTCRGRTMLMVEWAEETGIALKTIHRRLKLGWSHEDALTKPVRRRKRH